MKYGLMTSGNIRVFSKTKEMEGKGKIKYEITDYWINVSEKTGEQDKDGKDVYLNKSINLVFKKDSEKPTNNTVMNLKEGYFLIKGTGKYAKPAIYVKDWDYNIEE